MKDLRSARRLIKIRQRRDKPTAERASRAAAAKLAVTSTLSAYTATGLAIEDQVRKAWRPWSVGLPVF